MHGQQNIIYIYIYIYNFEVLNISTRILPSRILTKVIFSTIISFTFTAYVNHIKVKGLCP